MAQIFGGCACGTIRYEANADPIVMVNCHCRDCQRFAGSGYAAIIVVPKAAVQLRGEPRFYRTVGDAGKAVDRGFCPTCGSPVIAQLERLPDLTGFTAASLDDPSQFKPTMDIFTASAHAWDHMDPDIEKKPRGMTA